MLIVTQSTFTSNHAQNGQGGGLHSSGTVRITTSTFADNTALGGSVGGGGGGRPQCQWHGEPDKPTVVHDSAPTERGLGRGGGLEVGFEVSGVVTLTNCTIAENVADSMNEEHRLPKEPGGWSLRRS